MTQVFRFDRRLPPEGMLRRILILKRNIFGNGFDAASIWWGDASVPGIRDNGWTHWTFTPKIHWKKGTDPRNQRIGPLCPFRMVRKDRVILTTPPTGKRVIGAVIRPGEATGWERIFTITNERAVRIAEGRDHCTHWMYAPVPQGWLKPEDYSWFRHMPGDKYGTGMGATPVLRQTGIWDQVLNTAPIAQTVALNAEMIRRAAEIMGIPPTTADNPPVIWTGTNLLDEDA